MNIDSRGLPGSQGDVGAAERPVQTTGQVNRQFVCTRRKIREGETAIRGTSCPYNRTSLLVLDLDGCVRDGGSALIRHDANK